MNSIFPFIFLEPNWA